MARNYQYSKKAGALQEAMHVAGDAPLVQQAELSAPTRQLMRQALNVAADLDQVEQVAGLVTSQTRANVAFAPPAPELARSRTSLEPRRASGRRSMWMYTVREGERVLVTHPGGRMEIVEGPKRIWAWGRQIQPMAHHVAHPGDFLIVKFRDGRQEHLPGPAHVWLDPRVHLGVDREEAVQIAANEAVVVYAEADGEVSRRVVHGPATFVPAPGEWLHTFRWHGPAPNAVGYQKVPGAMEFQKLWLMPDQMYHDVVDVRTADDAVLTVRLMLFYELRDIEGMLAATHDPIGDFVNAATSDVVDFVGRLSFDAFKTRTEELNNLATYPQLTARAEQAGYRIDKVVYRGYGAPPALQRLHDEATEARVRLQLQRATEQQSQELEDFKLDRRLAREGRERALRAQELELELELDRRKREAEREEERRDADQASELHARAEAHNREHLAALAAMGVDLTAVLTKGAPEQIIEVRGGGTPHVHLTPAPGHTR